MKKQILLLSCSLLIAVFIFSCKKDKDIATTTFLGKWKTSYGDTVVFARVNGQNIISYDRTMNPTLPNRSNSEYTYKDNKLGIKDGFVNPGSITGFRFFQSFKWLEEGRSFEIQGVEWFMFMSSTTTYFTFTKIL
jgi:hypothetical protein